MSVLEKLHGKRWVRWVGYPAFFNAAFLTGLHLTFPYDALRDRVAGEARKATGMNVEIGKIRLAGLTGVKISDLALSKSETNHYMASGEDGAPPPPPPARIEIDSLTAKADVFSMLSGKKAVKFAIDAWGGELNGRFISSPDESVFTASAKGINLAQSPIQAFAGLDMEGTLDSLKIDLQSPGADFSQAEGTIEIDGNGLLLNGGEVQQFELPKIALGALRGKITLEKGEGNFETFSIDGEDLEARIEGKLRMAPTFSQSSLNGNLRLKPSDDWWNRNEMLKTAANFALPAKGDGWRVIAIYGQLGKPGFRPQR